MCAEGDTAGAIRVLGAYSDCAGAAETGIPEAQLVHSRVPQPDEKTFTEETIFDHLFCDVRLKDSVCDCLEV